MENFCFLPYYDKTKKERYLQYKNQHNSLSWDDVFTYVNIGLDQPFYTNVQQIADPHKEAVLVNKYRQLDSSYYPADMEVIAAHYNPEGLVLRHDARIAFERMCETAEAEGIHLNAVSAFRSFSYQNTVYYKNRTPEIPLEEYQRIRDKVSARPGHSEHQTGLAADINELEETFETTPAGRWLAVNSFCFGFILRYPKGREAITGYSYEPWHFRYLGCELAEEVYYSGLTYDEFYVRFLA